MQSQKRILKIFLRLLSGEVLTKKELLLEYHVQASTIQRDIVIIDEVLDEAATSTNYLPAIGQIRRENRGSYQLTAAPKTNDFSDAELLAILKILLASRAFEKSELTGIIEKLLAMSANPTTLKKFTDNERLLYQAVPKDAILDKLALITQAILHNEMLEFDYQKNGEQRTFQRLPNALHFADLYFYMLSASYTAQDDTDFSKLNKFRINNMQHIKVIANGRKLPHKDRFESGVLRNQTGQLPF